MEGMDSSLYGEDSSKDTPDSVDDQNTEEATDLLAKDSFPGGCKVGDKYTIEITGDHGDQFSVKVLGDDETSETKPDDESTEDDMSEVNSKY